MERNHMDLSQKIPTYLTEKRNILRLIIFTAVFALVFINIYSPFEVTTWLYKASSRIQARNLDVLMLFYSSIIILTGVLVVVISRIILYQYTKKKGPVNLGNYLLWIAVEIVSMALFYALYERLFINDPRPFYESFKISIQNTALILLLPYSSSWLYFSWKDKNRQLQELSHSGISASESHEMIVFRDEKGTMRISVKSGDLLYLQAADNYVNLVYNNQGKQMKYLLRSSLKVIEAQLAELSFIRCHRSYIVNFEKVKIIRKEKEGLVIELEASPLIEIPVSKTYMEDVFKAFGYSG